MGREIRRVIPNWEHPRETAETARDPRAIGKFIPLYDYDYETHLAEWIDENSQWQRGEHPSQKGSGCKYYQDYAGDPTDPDMCRPKWSENEASWYQVYETVSEGTPVTPAFGTQQELIEYLVANGDFWDQKRRREGNCSMPCQPWSRDAAENFVKELPWMPSMIITNGKILSGSELAAFQGVLGSGIMTQQTEQAAQRRVAT